MRGSLCTVTTIPVGIPAQAERRRNSWPVRDFLFCGVSVARRGAWAARLTSGPVLQLRTLPPLTLVLGTQALPGIEVRRSRRAGQILPEFHEREPAVVSPMPGMNIRPVFASALRPVRGGTTLRAEYSSLLLSYLPPSCASRT